MTTETTPDTQATVIFSGGLDSTAALAWALDRYPKVRALGFAYGQRHVRELSAAYDIANKLGVPFTVQELDGIFHSSTLLADSEAPVPREAYDADSMASTVVHGRNMLFATVAVAQSRPGDVVVLGVHGGDHALYGDCRPEFWVPFAQATSQAYGVGVAVPWLRFTKARVVTEGVGYGAPLADTWSCYEGGELHCGRCGTCQERREAFAQSGYADPTQYASWYRA